MALERMWRDAESRGLDGERATAMALMVASARLADQRANEALGMQRRYKEALERTQKRLRALDGAGQASAETRARMQRELFDARSRELSAHGRALGAARAAEEAWQSWCQVAAACKPSLSRATKPGAQPDVIEEDWEYRAPAVPADPPEFRARPEREKPLVRGPLSVKRRTDGRWVVVDERRATGDWTVWVEAYLTDANIALVRLADAEGLP